MNIFALAKPREKTLQQQGVWTGVSHAILSGVWARVSHLRSHIMNPIFASLSSRHVGWQSYEVKGVAFLHSGRPQVHSEVK